MEQVKYSKRGSVLRTPFPLLSGVSFAFFSHRRTIANGQSEKCSAFGRINHMRG